MLREFYYILVKHCNSKNNKIAMRQFERFLTKQFNSLRLAIRRYHIFANDIIVITRTTLRCFALLDAKVEIMFQRLFNVKLY